MKAIDPRTELKNLSEIGSMADHYLDEISRLEAKAKYYNAISSPEKVTRLSFSNGYETFDISDIRDSEYIALKIREIIEHENSLILLELIDLPQIGMNTIGKMIQKQEKENVES